MNDYRSIKERLMSEVEILTKKQPMSKEDVCCLGEVVDMLKDIATIEAMDKYGDEYMEDRYSGDPYIRFPRMSYGDHHMDGDSYRRGRSPSTGRYVSMDDRPMHNDMRSGHSIDDRMIDALERMYDTAETEHERRKIDQRIAEIRRDK